MRSPAAARRAASAGPRRLWHGTVLAALLTGLTTLVRPDGDTWAAVLDLGVYNATWLGATAVCLGAARTVRTERVAWLATAAFCLLNAAGNASWTLLALQDAEVPVPSLGDVLYLASYPATYVALIALIRARVARFHASMWLDGLVGALAATAVAVTLLLAPSLRLTGGDLPAALTTLAYPVVDVVLLALLVAVAAVLGVRRDPALGLVAVGLVANLVADIGYLQQSGAGTYAQGGPLDLLWLVAPLTWAAAAELSRRRLTAPVADPATRVGWQVLLVPAACTVTSLGLLAMGWGDEYPALGAWCAVGCVLAGLARTTITFHDVRSFTEVSRQARTDELTGLDNRRAFLECAERVVADATATTPAALLLLDLDGFKEVNDSLGHAAGDELLAVVAGRLRQGAREADLVARLGGDEFAVLLPGTDVRAACERAERIRAQLLEVATVSGVRLHVGVSIGVATSPVPADSVAELLRCADVAMYAAKTDRGGVRVYADRPSVGSVESLRAMDELRTALADDTVDVHLQPQVSLTDDQVVGVEALVRWTHPTRGPISPAELLPLAERAGLLAALTHQVVDRALRAVATWWAEHPVPVSVNLTAHDVDDALPDRLAAALARHDLPAAALTVELVEDTLLADQERARDVLGRLRAMGLRVSIDDYGTGYSSLAYLDRLPADELKLDRSLVLNVGTTATARAIVRHTTALAHDLGLTLVAEGVEDEDTLHLVRDLGCDSVQGWVVARAMPVVELRAWLDARSSVRTAGAIPG